jgi:hypothetical protein
MAALCAPQPRIQPFRHDVLRGICEQKAKRESLWQIPPEMIRPRMIPKSGNRFSEKIMRQQE